MTLNYAIALNSQSPFYLSALQGVYYGEKLGILMEFFLAWKIEVNSQGTFFY